MYPTNNFLQKVQNGFAWTADTTVQGLTLLQYLRFKAVNPSNSGTLVQIYGFGGWAGATTNLTVYKNPTTSVTTNTLVPTNQNMSSANTPALTVTWDTSLTNLSGGTYVRTLPIGTQWQSFEGDVLFLYPGTSVGFSALPGVATNAI